MPQSFSYTPVSSATFLTSAINNATIPVNGYTILDSAANIANDFDLLSKYQHQIASITVTDPLATIPVSYAQFDNSRYLLSVSNIHSLTVSGVSFANSSSALSSGFVRSVSITDDALNISKYLDTFQLNPDKYTSITLLNQVTPLTINYTQLINDSAALKKISDYSLAVSEVPVSAMISVLSNSHVAGSISMTGNGKNISSNLDALQANVSHISTINVTEPISSIVITKEQLINDADVLAKLSGLFVPVKGVIGGLPGSNGGPGMTIEHVSVFDVGSVLANPLSYLVDKINITDTNANISSALTQLYAFSSAAKISSIASKIGTITVTDSNTFYLPTIDNNMLDKIVGGYTNKTNEVQLSGHSTYTVTHPNMIVHGLSPITTVVFTEPASDFTINIATNSVTSIIDNSGAFGTTVVNDVQRLQFSDGTITALDVGSTANHNSLDAAIMVSLVFGANALTTYFPMVVSLYDAGKTNAQVAALAIQSGLLAKQIASTSNIDFVDFLYTRITGLAPPASPSILNLYANALDLNFGTKAEFLDFASSQVPGSQLWSQIDYVGIQAHGLNYIPVN